MINISGKLVTLKEATEKDLDELYYWKYVEEEQAAKKWNAPYIPEPEISKMEFKQHWQETNEIIPNTPSALTIHTNEKLIGIVSCYWVDKHTNWLETGIVIYDKEYWNGGYGTEAYRLWIDYLFTTTDLHRLGMSTWSGNVRMMKAAEKIGMKEEARIRQARTVNGEYYDAIKMGMLRSEWELIYNTSSTIEGIES
ncbi:putative acetyltransferase [Alkalihalophilus pseudofirmus OF4]|uniref:Acetyltransferase n=1 Tax=Alkalihalophilus pseudofirmus (strain ATCC BAA-2126 / JCM 17055 / OF4) TaxID=398511 RepID=D3FRH8_ALKPO|nr:GNAT family protein [Alkalihalophilus pseudofirmus]ADC51569.1 putative acetyltransferase [Alkalihalophilus pseudofirmus OF4]